MSEVTSAGYVQFGPKLQRFVPYISADMALARAFSYILVGLLVLWMILGWLALALLPWLALGSQLLRFLVWRLATPWLLVSARWINLSWRC